MATTWIKGRRFGKSVTGRRAQSVRSVLTKALDYGKDEEKTELTAAIEYGVNSDKTDGGKTISTYMCTEEGVVDEFEMTHAEYFRKTDREVGGVLLYQIRQSFKPHTVKYRSPGLIADEPEEYKTFPSREDAEAFIDELKANGISDYVYESGDDITPEKANEIGHILAMEMTKGAHAFIVCTHIDKSHIHNHIYFNAVTIDADKKYNNKKWSSKKVSRISDMICEDYGLHAVENPARKSGYKLWEHPENKLSKMIDLETNKKAADSPGYRHWAELHSLKEAAKTLMFLQENELRSESKLSDALSVAKERMSEIKEEINTIDVRLDQIKTMQKHLTNYRKTKDIFTKYTKDKSLEALSLGERIDVQKHQEAKEYFDVYNQKTLPKNIELRREYETLRAQKNKLYKNHYHVVRNEIRQLEIAKENRAIMMNDIQRNKGKETER